jgi:hypothetical protein
MQAAQLRLRPGIALYPCRSPVLPHRLPRSPVARRNVKRCISPRFSVVSKVRSRRGRGVSNRSPCARANRAPPRPNRQAHEDVEPFVDRPEPARGTNGLVRRAAKASARVLHAARRAADPPANSADRRSTLHASPWLGDASGSTAWVWFGLVWFGLSSNGSANCHCTARTKRIDPPHAGCTACPCPPAGRLGRPARACRAHPPPGACVAAPNSPLPYPRR